MPVPIYEVIIVENPLVALLECYYWLTLQILWFFYDL